MSKTKTNKNNKHLRPQRGLGQAVSRQRKRANDALKREADSRIDRERQMARELLAQNERQDPARKAEFLWRHNLLKATIDHQSAVMNSYGINVPVKAALVSNPWAWQEDRTTIKAYTDYESIVIRFPSRLLPADRSNTTAIMDSIATLRGIFQHELGHIRFTTPFTDLKFGDHTDRHQRELHWPWNCLEDQRMETAVVAGVPRLASYFTTMVVEHIINGDNPVNSWLLVAGRTYLPTAMRQQSRDLFVKVHGESLAQRWSDEVVRYIGATTHDELRASVLRARALLDEIMSDLPESAIDEHSYGDSNDDIDPADSASDVDNDDLDKGESGDGEGTGESSDEESDDESTGTGNGESDTDADSDEGEDDEGTSSSNDGDESSESGSEGESTASDDESSQDSEAQSPNDGATDGSIDTSKIREEMERIMREVLDEAVNEMRSDDTINEILVDANELTNDTGSIPFLSGQSAPMPADMQAQAETLAVGMQNALNDFVTASQPVWMSHQDHGVIDPIAFRTKSIGDTDYRRGLNGDFTEGLDVHVSLLCDVSVSMSGEPMEALSKVIYATSKACDNLGIGLTTTLWSDPSETYRLAPDDVRTPLVYQPLGGTDPTGALDDLDSHDIGNVENHLVLIFTDGQWMERFPGVQNWERPGRHTVLVEYNEYFQHAGMLGESTDKRGCDEAFRIGDILNLPMELTSAIAGLLSK